jgi:hypothetical protein
VSSTFALALLGPAAVHAGGGQAKPKANVDAPAAMAKPLAQLSKSELQSKLASTPLPKLTTLFEPLEGDEIPEMFADGTQGGFDLVYRGVKATAFDDAEGTDEVAVWIALVRPTASGYTKSLHKLAAPGALSPAHAASNAGAATLFHGDRGPALLLGAVIEDDDGSAAQRMAELDVLLDQAIAAATILRDDGDDPLELGFDRGLRWTYSPPARAAAPRRAPRPRRRPHSSLRCRWCRSSRSRASTATVATSCASTSRPRPAASRDAW